MGKQTKKKLPAKSQMLESAAARRRREEAEKALSDAERGPAQPTLGGGQLVSPEQRSMEEAIMEERMAAQIKARKDARESLNQETQQMREQDAVDQVVRDRSENEARRRRLMKMAENYSRLQFEGGPSKVQ